MTTATWVWQPQASCLECEHPFACGALSTCLGNPTDAARLDSVTRAVDYMRSRIAEPQRLSDIARAALLSPFHFHRIFRHVTSTTPARFLTALRMAEARRLLATSDLSVTEVCLAVGYSSLGTFISQFNKLAGLPPRRFRSMLTDLGDTPLGDLAGAGVGVGVGAGEHTAPGPLGAVTGGHADGGHALLALYGNDAQDDDPVTYGMLRTNRLTHVKPLIDGEYHAVAVGFPARATLADVLGGTRTAEFVGSVDTPIVVAGGLTRSSFHVALRPPRSIDPPLQLTSELLTLVRLTRPAGSRTVPVTARCATP